LKENVRGIGRKWQIPVIMICGLCLWCVFDRGLVTAAAALPPEVEPSHSSSTSTAAADEKEIAIISSSDFGETQEIVGPVVESEQTDPALLSATADRSCCRHIGAQSAMLEAFHQFQHNPQVQSMVVSLATDKGVWDAVLANEKIQEFRRALRTEADGTLQFHHFTPHHPPRSGFAQHNVFCMKNQWFQTTV
jgi:hypothetical protein